MRKTRNADLPQFIAEQRRRSSVSSVQFAEDHHQERITMNTEDLLDPTLGLGPDMDLGMHSGHSPEGLPSATHSEHLQAIEDDEDTEISEDISKELVRSVGRNSALVKRKTTAMIERMAAKEAQQMPSLAQGVEQLLSLDIQQLKKRGRGEGSDSAAEPETGGRRPRRAKNDDFNAASLIGSIFMRVQGTKAPAPLVYFDDDINNPQWFKESIDGVQPVMGFDDFDPEQVNLESMGKLVDGNVLPATLGEVAAYFTHVLGDPRTNKEIAPRVLIAIQCDRAKGWFTYKRDNDNNNFVPVVLCAAENGRGLEEVSPAHFEVHRAQCAQKKWRQSFKVLGAQKLHKVTSLAQAALGDVLRHLERILGAERPMQLRSVDANNAANNLPPVARVVSAANHPTFRQPISSEQAAVDEGIVRGAAAVAPRDAVQPRASAVTIDPNTVVLVGSSQQEEAVRRMLSTNNPTARLIHEPALATLQGVPRMPTHVAGVSPGRASMLPGARPVTAAPPPPGGSRLVVGGKPLLRRHTDDPAAAARLAGDPGRGLDLLATAASTAITSPRAGGVGATGVQASLLAAALSGVSFNELLQLVIDNTTRRQQHAQQAQLLQQLATLQAQQAATEKLQAAAAIEQAAGAAKPVGAAPAEGAADAAGAAAAAGPSAAAATPAVVPPAALSRAECEAIAVIVKNVRGLDVSHAVRGILQHVAMQHVGEQPSAAEAIPALAEAVHRAAEAEGLAHVEQGAAQAPEMDAEAVVQAAETATETIEVDMDEGGKIE